MNADAITIVRAGLNEPVSRALIPALN